MLTSLTDAIDRLVAIASDPTSGRADIVKAATQIRSTNAYKRFVADDPLIEAVWNVLSACTVDEDGCARHEGNYLSVKQLCAIIGKEQTPSVYAKVGKICANHGYRRLQSNDLAPTRLLAPRHLW